MSDNSSAARSILDMSPDEWQRALRLDDDDLPVAVISEGSWWREQRTGWRLGALDGVRELAFPDMFLGRWRDRPVVYCCAYGAPRAVEVVHLFGSLGARLAIQIGTCGGLQGRLQTGDVVVPDVAACQEGIARIYGAGEHTLANPEWSDRARSMLTTRDHTVHKGTNLTWFSIFAQSGAMVEAWHDAGYLSVDMETATTFAVSRYFDMPAVSMLVVWDDLLQGRSFLDPLEPSAQQKLDDANEAVFEVALDLVQAL
ncbi:purine nucleoside phosphorylase DeoD-type [bacterium BMS3Abin02]|nr:purine nucleoside phosphorylase DeoD-type [bacterium BMS3Abin02]GBE20871.1 purine nucleoside phosphorylase DeoD-type [bacterium BMS3Bbin01]HDH27033.1 hypothetical protein [Actinomycetota bacterium]HDL50080.1 hypothetical protein [Actinomycetota bacterium]